MLDQEEKARDLSKSSWGKRTLPVGVGLLPSNRGIRPFDAVSDNKPIDAANVEGAVNLVLVSKQIFISTLWDSRPEVSVRRSTIQSREKWPRTHHFWRAESPEPIFALQRGRPAGHCMRARYPPRVSLTSITLAIGQVSIDYCSALIRRRVSARSSMNARLVSSCRQQAGMAAAP